MVPTAAMLSAQQESMVWLKIGATYYHAQLGSSDNDRAIKELVEWRAFCPVPYILHFINNIFSGEATL